MFCVHIGFPTWISDPPAPSPMCNNTSHVRKRHSAIRAGVIVLYSAMIVWCAIRNYRENVQRTSDRSLFGKWDHIHQHSKTCEHSRAACASIYNSQLGNHGRAAAFGVAHLCVSRPLLTSGVSGMFCPPACITLKT